MNANDSLPGTDVAVAERGAQKRLLLVKLGAIGDAVMAIPAAAAMHAAGYAVDWVASETIAPVLRLYPWIHVIPVDEAGLFRAGLGTRLRQVASLWRVLRHRASVNGAYDVCAVLYYDRRYSLLTLPVRARRHVLLSAKDRNRRLLPGRHHTDEYARVLTGRPDTETPCQLAPVRPPVLPPDPLPRGPNRARVVLVPAGARNLLRDDALRRWPVESYVAVARQLLLQGCEVVLAGGPDDRWASASFAELAATAQPGNAAATGSFADAIGTLSLQEMLGLLNAAAVTVTHDTGPLHLAGITSTGIVAIFGPTDPRGRLPQRSGSVALWGGEGFACRPCYDGREYAPCPHNGCMHQVTPERVVTEVLLLLEARGQGRSLPPRVLTPERPPAAPALLWPIGVKS